MNLDNLLDEIGEDGLYTLLNGWYAYIIDETANIATGLRSFGILDVPRIDTFIDRLAHLKVVRVQYDELGKALDEYAILKEKEE